MKKLTLFALSLFALTGSLLLNPDSCKAQCGYPGGSTWTIADSVQTIYVKQTCQTSRAYTSYKLNKAGLSYTQASAGAVTLTGTSVTGAANQFTLYVGNDSIVIPGTANVTNSNTLFSYFNFLILPGYYPVSYNAAGAHALKTNQGIIAGVFIDSAGTVGGGPGVTGRVSVWDGLDSLPSHSVRIFSGSTTTVGQFLLNANCKTDIYIKLYGTVPGRLTFTYR